jgi:hypothetical protein
LTGRAVYGQGKFRYGSWFQALTFAGFDPENIRRRMSWSKDSLIEAIRLLHLNGVSLNTRAIDHDDSLRTRRILKKQFKIDISGHAVFTRAISPQYFGSWDAALLAAGLDPSRIRRDHGVMQWRRSRHLILEAVRILYEKGVDLNAGAIQRDLSEKTKNILKEYFGLAISGKAVYLAGRRAFKSWDNALRLIGLDPEDIRKQTHMPWTNQQLVRAIRYLHQKKVSLNSYDIQRDDSARTTALLKELFGVPLTGRSVFAAASSPVHFGSWDAALTAADLDPQHIRKRTSASLTPDGLLIVTTDELQEQVSEILDDSIRMVRQFPIVPDRETVSDSLNGLKGNRDRLFEFQSIVGDASRNAFVEIVAFLDEVIKAVGNEAAIPDGDIRRQALRARVATARLESKTDLKARFSQYGYYEDDFEMRNTGPEKSLNPFDLETSRDLGRSPRSEMRREKLEDDAIRPSETRAFIQKDMKYPYLSDAVSLFLAEPLEEDAGHRQKERVLEGRMESREEGEAGQWPAPSEFGEESWLLQFILRAAPRAGQMMLLIGKRQQYASMGDDLFETLRVLDERQKALIQRYRLFDRQQLAVFERHLGLEGSLEWIERIKRFSGRERIIEEHLELLNQQMDAVFQFDPQTVTVGELERLHLETDRLLARKGVLIEQRTQAAIDREKFLDMCDKILRKYPPEGGISERPESRSDDPVRLSGAENVSESLEAIAHEKASETSPEGSSNHHAGYEDNPEVYRHVLRKKIAGRERIFLSDEGRTFKRVHRIRGTNLVEKRFGLGEENVSSKIKNEAVHVKLIYERGVELAARTYVYKHRIIQEFVEVLLSIKYAERGLLWQVPEKIGQELLVAWARLPERLHQRGIFDLDLGLHNVGVNLFGHLVAFDFGFMQSEYPGSIELHAAKKVYWDMIARVPPRLKNFSADLIGPLIESMFAYFSMSPDDNPVWGYDLQGEEALPRLGLPLLDEAAYLVNHSGGPFMDVIQSASVGLLNGFSTGDRQGREGPRSAPVSEDVPDETPRRERPHDDTPRSEVRESFFKRWAVPVFLAVGWAAAISNVVLTTGYFAWTQPGVLARFLSVMFESWVLIATVAVASHYQKKPLKQIAILVSGIVLAAVVFHPWSGYTLASLAWDVLLRIGPRIGVIYAAVYFADFVTAWVLGERNLSAIFRRAGTASWRWSLSVGLIGSYFLYFSFLPFIRTEISGNALRSLFDLGVGTLTASLPLTLATGIAFGEGKDLIADFRDITKSKTIRAFQRLYPVNFLYWFPMLWLYWWMVTGPVSFVLCMVYMEVCPFGIEMMKKKRYEFLTPQ